MKTKKSAMPAFASSDESSDAEEIVKTHIEDDESDIEEELFHEDDEEDLVSSTQIAPQEAAAGSSVKAQLAKALMKMPCAQSRNAAAFKRVQWDKLKIPGCSTEDLKKHLKEILKMTSNVRTLGEILTDFEKNESRLTSRTHADFPTRPTSAHIKYITDHRDELTKLMEKQNPGQKVQFVQIMKLGSEKFNELSAKKQEKYKKIYQEEMEEFKKKVVLFYKKHPELKPKAAPRVKGQPRELTIYTPVLFFREKISEDGELVPLPVAQKKWRELPTHEKGRYINDLANLITDKLKKFSKSDFKLMDTYNGIPPRPYTNAYNVFVKKFNQNYHGVGKDLLVASSEAWKKVTPEEKARCQKVADEEMEEWIEKMQEHINTLEPGRRAIVEAKYGLAQLIRKRKAKKASIDETVPSKRVKLESEATGDEANESKKKKKNGESSPTKSLSPEKSLSPKKKKLQVPEYPSQSTAHYFMHKVYDGKPSKIAKAYKKLTPQQKKAYRETCVKERNEYLHKLASYMAQLSTSEKEEFQKKITKARDAQKELVAEWHVSTGTDNQARQDDTSSDDDSDES